ncbi:helix-turn-helix domain-containing protein [Pseudogracilibacillus sp. SO30301A]|uniref:helix-turn-helix domain-containing protein n=1 Tax=Pseudogracilibacillus sp. SO30301A TaxID=3098291 RepID=UPI00300E42BA
MADSLDAAKARQIRRQICETSGLSERTIRMYLAQYRKAGFEGLKPKGKGTKSKEHIVSNLF